MTLSANGLNLIKSFEGLRLNAYQDDAEVWTIGYGTITYPNGTKVKKGDVITQAQADQYLNYEVNIKTRQVIRSLPPLNQNQFDSLISFAYNVGSGGLLGSTLLKRVKANPLDPTIADAFMMWNKIRVNGKLVVSDGLTARRKKEAEYYFKTSQ